MCRSRVTRKMCKLQECGRKTVFLTSLFGRSLLLDLLNLWPSPGILLEVEILQLLPRPTESEIVL